MTKRVETESIIHAPADVVWAILSDFERLSEWNYFIPGIEGEKSLGSILRVQVRLGTRALTFRARLIEFEANRALCWRGRLPIRGLASGEHGFYIEPLDNTRVRFVHRETFRGLLIPALFPIMERKLRASFVAMDQALKRRAEAQFEAANSPS